MTHSVIVCHSINRVLIPALAILCAGCSHSNPKPPNPKQAKNTTCCGLSGPQWDAYRQRAAEAVVDPEAWESVNASKPRGIQPVPDDGPAKGATNSPNSVKPPTQVTIYIPIGDSAKGRNMVEVMFSHPDGTIVDMNTGSIMF